MAPGILVQDHPEPHLNGLANNDTHDYEVTEKPLGEPRKLRVITIGAGASGLNMARQIESHMKNVEHIVYEKNEDVGGTWFENRLAKENPCFPQLRTDIHDADTPVARVIFLATTTNLPGSQIQIGALCMEPPTHSMPPKTLI